MDYMKILFLYILALTTSESFASLFRSDDQNSSTELMNESRAINEIPGAPLESDDFLGHHDVDASAHHSPKIVITYFGKPKANRTNFDPFTPFHKLFLFFLLNAHREDMDRDLEESESKMVAPRMPDFFEDARAFMAENSRKLVNGTKALAGRVRSMVPREVEKNATNSTEISKNPEIVTPTDAVTDDNDSTSVSVTSNSDMHISENHSNNTSEMFTEADLQKAVEQLNKMRDTRAAKMNNTHVSDYPSTAQSTKNEISAIYPAKAVEKNTTLEEVGFLHNNTDSNINKLPLSTLSVHNNSWVFEPDKDYVVATKVLNDTSNLISMPRAATKMKLLNRSFKKAEAHIKIRNVINASIPVREEANQTKSITQLKLKTQDVPPSVNASIFSVIPQVSRMSINKNVNFLKPYNVAEDSKKRARRSHLEEIEENIDATINIDVDKEIVRDDPENPFVGPKSRSNQSDLYLIINEAGQPGDADESNQIKSSVKGAKSVKEILGDDLERILKPILNGYKSVGNKELYSKDEYEQEQSTNLKKHPLILVTLPTVLCIGFIIIALSFLLRSGWCYHLFRQKSSSSLLEIENPSARRHGK